MKLCKGCGAEKVPSEFYVHERMADGHLSFCKDCKRKNDNRAKAAKELF